MSRVGKGNFTPILSQNRIPPCGTGCEPLDSYAYAGAFFNSRKLAVGYSIGATALVVQSGLKIILNLLSCFQIINSTTEPFAPCSLQALHH